MQFELFIIFTDGCEIGHTHWNRFLNIISVNHITSKRLNSDVFLISKNACRNGIESARNNTELSINRLEVWCG